jgi:glycosyltransferase involved in cell wall biosynthesis
MNTAVDLSVIVTVHDETLVAGPSMAAVEASIAAAEAAGIVVERVMTLDNATPEAAAWFGQARFDHWDRHVMEEGDLGRVRNAVLPRTQGRFIAFLDADDLFSESWLREGVQALRRAEEAGQRAIAHPELNWLFDGAHSVFVKPDLDDPLYSPWHFYFMNYYDSLCMAPRAAHLEHPYVHRDIPAGLSFQDWQFSIETIAAGWHHLAARNTIIFKRRRDNSLVTESRARRALVRAQPSMRIDRVDGLGRPAPDRETPSGGPSGGPSGAPVVAPMDIPAPAKPPSSEPYYGPVLAERIARAKTARKGRVPLRHMLAYKTVAAHFDHAYYLAANRDLIPLDDFDLVAHYLRAGVKEKRNPTPWFSTAEYLAQNPDVAKSGVNPFYHWLTKGRAAGLRPYPMRHFETIAQTIGLDPAHARDLWQARYDDLRARLETGPLGAEVQKVAAFEPLVEQGWPEALTVKLPPFHTNVVNARTSGIWRLNQAADMRPARYVICLNRSRFGAAPRIEGHIARALTQRVAPEDIVVITTDRSGEAFAPGKFPEGLRVVDFAHLQRWAKGDIRQRMLAEFLRALAPEAVFNINSRLMWDMMGPYGRALSASTRLYACLLCNERTPAGYATGYPLRRVYRHFEDLSGIFTDSHALANDLRQRHMLPPDQAGRIAVLPNPVNPDIAPCPAPRPAEGRRPQIFWAGRFDAQKRVDLAHAIARALPECDLRMWGSTVMGGSQGTPAPDNVTHEGEYAQFDDLPLPEADLWLYTSAWDGVPTMLLEVAMTGLPMVGTDVGGTGEVLQDGYARALPADALPEAYAAAIRAILADPDRARAQATALRDRLIAERTPAAQAEALFALLDAPASDSAPARETIGMTGTS